MGSAAEAGLGVVLTVGGNDIAEITDIGEYGITRQDIDVTSHDASGNAEEFIAGIISSEEISVTCNLKTGDTGQMAVITYCAAGTKCPCKITLPNTAASTYAWIAYVKNWKIKDDLKGILKLTFTLKNAYAAPVWTV